MKYATLLLIAMIAVNFQPSLAKTPQAKLTEANIKNSEFPLPRLSRGYDMIKFNNGKYKEDEVSAQMCLLAFGQLNKQPAAVVFVGWSTGGSGWWEELALYRLVDGKAKCVGLYGLEDRAKINSIRIAENRIILDWVKHADNDPAPFPSVHEVKKLQASDFVAPSKD